MKHSLSSPSLDFILFAFLLFALPVPLRHSSSRTEINPITGLRKLNERTKGEGDLPQRTLRQRRRENVTRSSPAIPVIRPLVTDLRETIRGAVGAYRGFRRLSRVTILFSIMP